MVIMFYKHNSIKINSYCAHTPREEDRRWWQDRLLLRDWQIYSLFVHSEILLHHFWMNPIFNKTTLPEGLERNNIIQIKLFYFTVSVLFHSQQNMPVFVAGWQHI